MSTTVNSAFEIFMRDVVRLDNVRNKIAKNSKDFLISEIKKFPNDGEFLNFYLGVQAQRFDYSNIFLTKNYQKCL